MMKLLLATVAFVALFATQSFAQMTGPSALVSIQDGLTAEQMYKIEMGSNSVTLRDASTGAEVFRVSEPNAQTVTLSGVVTSLRHLTPEQRERIMKKIAFFNHSSSVGTLLVDPATGDVTMEHHLNPRLVSTSGMVKVATLFGDIVRAESSSLLQ